MCSYTGEFYYCSTNVVVLLLPRTANKLFCCPRIRIQLNVKSICYLNQICSVAVAVFHSLHVVLSVSALVVENVLKEILIGRSGYDIIN